jgi:hypothetical protein
MSTSGVTAWSLTARDIVTAAMQEIGVTGLGETPEASEMAKGLQCLNAMLKSWQTEGNLFREATADVTADDASTTLAAGIRSVNSVRLLQSGGTDRLLYPWTRTDYLSLPNKAAEGNPSIYYVERGRTGVILYVWPVPTANATIRVDYARIIETVTDASEEVDVPEEWQETVIAGLASRLAPIFGVTRTDPGTVQRIDARAAELYRRMLDADRPDAYRFTYEGAEY